MRKISLSLLLLLSAALIGCVARPAGNRAGGPAVLLEVPQTRQATPYTCGVAVLQSVLAYNGHLYRQDVLEEKVGATPEFGTNPQAMVNLLVEHGIGAVIVQNITLPQLRAHIDSGRLVICFLQAWNDDPAFDYSVGWEDGHYAIAIGYNDEKIFFMDPSTLGKYAYIGTGEFLVRWHDGDENKQLYQAGIVVTSPTPFYARDSFSPML